MTAANPTKAEPAAYRSFDIFSDPTLVFSDTARGNGARVASAWKHLPTMDQDLLADSSRRTEAYRQLDAAICLDIGSDPTRVWQPRLLDWTYGPFIKLYLRFGEEWPLEALTVCMQIFYSPRAGHRKESGLRWGQAEQWAQTEWLRAVESYESIKRHKRGLSN